MEQTVHGARYKELAAHLAAATLSEDEGGPPAKVKMVQYSRKQQRFLGVTAKGATASNGAAGAMCAIS